MAASTVRRQCSPRWFKFLEPFTAVSIRADVTLGLEWTQRYHHARSRKVQTQSPIDKSCLARAHTQGWWNCAQSKPNQLCYFAGTSCLHVPSPSAHESMRWVAWLLDALRNFCSATWFRIRWRHLLHGSRCSNTWSSRYFFSGGITSSYLWRFLGIRNLLRKYFKVKVLLMHSAMGSDSAPQKISTKLIFWDMLFRGNEALLNYSHRSFCLVFLLKSLVLSSRTHVGKIK